MRDPNEVYMRIRKKVCWRKRRRVLVRSLSVVIGLLLVAVLGLGWKAYAAKDKNGLSRISGIDSLQKVAFAEPHFWERPTEEQSKIFAQGLNHEESSLEEFISGILPGHLSACGFDLSQHYSFSNAFEVQNSSVESNWLFFVFCGDECVGELVISAENGWNSFFREACESITELYRREVPVSIVCANDVCLYVVSPETGDVVSIYGVVPLSSDYSIVLEACQTIVLQNEIDTSNLNYGSSQEQMETVTRECGYLSVPIVPNESVPSQPNGLCWVASSLSVIKYYVSGVTYNVNDFYYFYLTYYPGSMYGSPNGDFDCVKRYYIIYSLSYSGGWYGLSFSAVKNVINNGKPIIAGISTALISGSQVGHVVVICGYNKVTQSGAVYYYYYRLMDPNCSSYVTISAPSSGNGIYYNAGSHIYVNWEYCVY